MLQKIKLVLRNVGVIAFVLVSNFSNTLGQSFLEVSLQSGVNMVHVHPMLMGGGVAFFDYDMDGFQDLYITGGTSSDKLYRNNGNGTFTDVTTIAGILGTDSILTIGVATGDIDNDGYREIFVTTWQGYTNVLFKNNGDGTFTDISASANVADSSNSISVTFGDVNKDGLLDIYVANYMDLVNSVPQNGFDYTCFANFLYINNGNQTFIESGLAYGVADTGCALATAFTNFDNESDMDIYIANDFGAWVRPNTILENNFPSSNFTDIAFSASVNDSMYGMGIAIGDYDEDGDLDYYITNLGKNVMRNNQGNSTFLDKTDTSETANTYTDSTSLAVGWGTAFFDYDNDTYLDLIVANGYITADSFTYNTPFNPNVLFKNDGDATFTDVSDLEGFNDTTYARGLALGDINMDGRLDVAVSVVTADTSSSSHFLLYKNANADSNNWLSVSLQGVVNNRDGFGSRIRLFAGGRSWIREVDGGSSHASHSMSNAYFGLGSLTIVDSVIVTWLNGNQETFANIYPNQHLQIIEDSTIYGIVYMHEDICGGDSIFLEDTFQFVGGIYRDTLPAYSGNDSIVVTILGLISADSVVIDTTFCELDSFWGNTYTSDTTLVSYLTGFKGCDSTVTTNITVNPFIFFTTPAVSLCQGELFNSTAYSADTTLIDTVQNQFLCDSIISTSIIVLVKSFVSDTVSLCQGELYNGTAYSADTTLIDTLQNQVSCDSITSTSIIVLVKSFVSDTVSICQGDIFGGFQFFSDTTVTDSLTGINGCDSIIVTNVNVDSPILSSSTVILCQGDLHNGTAYSDDTTLIDTVQNQFSCDSIRSTNLVIVTISSSSSNATICKGEVFDGTIYFADTALIDTLTGSNGCDSIVTTILKVDSTFSIIVDTIIESGQSYFGVVYTSDTVLLETFLSIDGCDSLVQSNLSIVTGLPPDNQFFFYDNFSVFPNPTSGSISISFSLERASAVSIIVSNMLGEVISILISGTYHTGNHYIHWSGKTDAGASVAAGVYSIRYYVNGTRRGEQLLVMSNSGQ